jgi:cytochrome c biogenesis protein CcdA
MSENNKNIRDEQFWFTTAVVGFNGYFLTRVEVSVWLAVIGVMVVSILGIYLNVNRWAEAANVNPDKVEPKFERPAPGTHRWTKRIEYTLNEWRVAGKYFGWVIVECSGTFFYVVIIIVSCIAVVLKNWPLLFSCR